MRIKTYALLISGIFLVMLMASTSALEGVAYPGGDKWRPIQDQELQSGKEKGLPGADPWAGGNSYPHHGAQSFRFRPWNRYRGQENRSTPYRVAETSNTSTALPDHGYQQPSVNPGQPYWRPAPQATYNGFPGHDAGNQYRFRPMDRERRNIAPLRRTYRPAQIEIPNHYVYRPLKVKRHRNSVNNQRLKTPDAPGMDVYGFMPLDRGYGGYAPAWVPLPGIAPPSYAPDRYADRYKRFSDNRQSGRFTGQPRVSRYPYNWGYSAPRYTGQIPFGGHRFRPLKRSRWDGYAANPYVTPNYQRRAPVWGYQYGMQPGWYPQMSSPYSGVQQAMGPDVRTRYGVDWYDGRADGDGAWYKLAGWQEWPRVSHYLPLD